MVNGSKMEIETRILTRADGTDRVVFNNNFLKLDSNECMSPLTAVGARELIY